MSASSPADPSGLAGGINLYAYAGDDPVDLSDPTGTGGYYNGADPDIPNLGTVTAYTLAGSAEGYYGGGYGYGVVEVGLGIALDLGSVGFGGVGNSFNGSRIANRDGVPAPVGGFLYQVQFPGGRPCTLTCKGYWIQMETEELGPPMGSDLEDWKRNWVSLQFWMYGL